MSRRTATPPTLVGPYDMRDIARRIEKKCVELGLTAKEVYSTLNWSKSTWSEKTRLKDSSINIIDVSHICAALELLRPNWKTPTGFPFIDEKLSRIIDRHLE